MGWFGKGRAQPWPIAIAAGVLIVIIAVAGLVGLVQNLYVKEIAEEDLQYAVDLENRGSDLETAVLDVRFHHSRLAASEPSREDLAAFEDAYRKLHEQIDRVRKIGVRDSAAARLDLLDERAEDYYSDFRPAVDRRETGPEAFRDADQKGEADLAALELSAGEIERLGERSMATARENMARAEDVERVVLLLVAAGLIMALAALAYSAVRMVRMFEELRELNDRQRATAEALEAASRAKTDFLADVSHELKTPLTVLRGNAELGLRGGGDRTEVLGEIVRESGRMQRMIDDLLFLARSDSESLPLEPEPVGEFLAGLANRAGVLARERGASFEATLAGEGLLRVDPARVEQAVLILVDNAAKYGPKAGRVTLSSSVENAELSIVVEDEGPGIPRKDLPRVFERFYRVDKTRARRHGGAGLGLSIARTIVEAHGGRIEAESRVGEGTRMSVFLPVEAGTPAAIRFAEEVVAFPGDGAGRRAVPEGRVLVIEDDPGIADLLRRGLGSHGMRVAVAEDGAAGREAWSGGGFDVVLLDVMLPGIDGISLLSERRAAGDETPVVLLTARDDEDALERGMAAGATDYVSKPFSFEDLIPRVGLLLSATAPAPSD